MRHTLRNLRLAVNNSNHQVCRICCVCRKLQPIVNMVRVVRVDGEYLVQGHKRLNGRGAHVCPTCLTNPNLQKSLSRSFKAPLPTDLIQNLNQLYKK